MPEAVIRRDRALADRGGIKGDHGPAFAPMTLTAAE